MRFVPCLGEPHFCFMYHKCIIGCITIGSSVPPTCQHLHPTLSSMYVKINALYWMVVIGLICGCMGWICSLIWYHSPFTWYGMVMNQKCVFYTHRWKNCIMILGYAIKQCHPKWDAFVFDRFFLALGNPGKYSNGVKRKSIRLTGCLAISSTKVRWWFAPLHWPFPWFGDANLQCLFQRFPNYLGNCLFGVHHLGIDFVV